MRWSDLFGSRIDHYQIIDELGRGGASRVFRAHDSERSRFVALKILPIEADDHRAFLLRFAREAQIITSLRHPNIVDVYDSGQSDEFVYLVMQLLEGGTLRQRLTSAREAFQRLSVPEACHYIVQMALALHHAHQQGVVHRDVKPSNMLLDSDPPGHILLSDFGAATILGARQLTKTGVTFWMPEYMSPEQASGHEIDQRTDIYSLGCVLYETLAGRPPFVGETPLASLYQQVYEMPTDIRSYNADVPRELWNVLRSCVAKRPEDRFGTAEHLADALLPFTGGWIEPAPWAGNARNAPQDPAFVDATP